VCERRAVIGLGGPWRERACPRLPASAIARLGAGRALRTRPGSVPRGCRRLGSCVRHPLEHGGADPAPVGVSPCRVELQSAKARGLTLEGVRGVAPARAPGFPARSRSRTPTWRFQGRSPRRRAGRTSSCGLPIGGWLATPRSPNVARAAPGGTATGHRGRRSATSGAPGGRSRVRALRRPGQGGWGRGVRGLRTSRPGRPDRTACASAASSAQRLSRTELRPPSAFRPPDASRHPAISGSSVATIENLEPGRHTTD
jgi:hypothetical protein